MKEETRSYLETLRKNFGSKHFGKIAQKLLALTFHEMGFTNIVEHSTQGVDIEITSQFGEKFAIEVKTTETLSFSLTAENVQALKDRIPDGYQPVIAVLRLAPLENWILAKIPIDKIPTGEIKIDGLRPYRMIDLERELDSKFDIVVKKHFTGVSKKGEQYLKEHLRKVGIMAQE